MSAVWWGNCLGCGRGPRTIYQYLAVEQPLFSCELDRYTAFGIAAQKRVPDGWRQIAFVPDICTNAQQAQRLALFLAIGHEALAAGGGHVPPVQKRVDIHPGQTLVPGHRGPGLPQKC